MLADLSKLLRDWFKRDDFAVVVAVYVIAVGVWTAVVFVDRPTGRILAE